MSKSFEKHTEYGDITIAVLLIFTLIVGTIS